jgi:membrane protease YdiL (CAAX protease family)
LLTILFVLVSAPFYLNDFSSIYIDDWRIWLSIDYIVVKLLPLGLIAWAVSRKHLHWPGLGFQKQSLAMFLVAFSIATLAGTLIDQNAYSLLEGLPGYAALGGMPAIDNRTWDWIDLTLGLLMVGIVEELVFRGYLLYYLESLSMRRGSIILISSLAFGLIHWSLGLNAVLITSLIGAVFMIVYLATRSLPAIMLAHFAVNFIDFAGVIPKAVFKFT